MPASSVPTRRAFGLGCLDGANPRTVLALLTPLPEPVRIAFRQRRRRAYQAISKKWNT
jgi:hypothetical protein